MYKCAKSYQPYNFCMYLFIFIVHYHYTIDSMHKIVQRQELTVNYPLRTHFE